MSKSGTTSKSHSSIPGLGLIEKFRENIQLLSMRLRGTPGAETFDPMFSTFDEYDRELKARVGISLADAKILEIGYGARPNELLALTSLGIDAIGIDLDRPTLKLTPSTVWDIYRRNGWERALKSTVRGLLFDRGERKALAEAVRRRGGDLRIMPDKFLVGDASTAQFPAGSFDLIYSENVFEHIPAQSLPPLIKNIAAWLNPNGLALIRPDVFTGISGSHLAEWYPHTVDNQHRSRRAEPWEHLRKRRFGANCFLNELRLRDYRTLFGEHFDIVNERFENPDRGKQYLSPSIRQELAEYDDEELFANRVLFVLKPVRRVAN